MTKVKPTKEVAKDGIRQPKQGSIHKKKQQKFKNTPTGKVALIDGKNPQQKSNGKLMHQNSPKQHKSPKGLNKQSNSPKNKGSKKSPKIKIEKEQDDDDSSVDDINEGISIHEEISAPEDGIDDDSSSSETETAVPDIFGQSLAEETDEDDDEFDAESDEDEDEDEDDAAENKGVKMFKGLQSKVDPKASSNIEEEDDDDDDENTQHIAGLEDLIRANIPHESDDEDFDEDEDEDSDEEIDQSLNSSKSTSTGEDDDDEEADDDDDDDDEDDEESSDDEAAPDLTALLGNSIAEDSDDEDFEGDESDEDDEDEDISDDDEDVEDTQSPRKKVKAAKTENAEEEDEDEDDDDDDDDDDDNKSESFDSTKDKSETDESGKKPKLTAEERKERDERTIFIGNVPKETKVSRIKSMFKKFGTIESIRLRGIIPENPKMPLKVAAIKKKFHSKSKTICVFVTFESAESAEKALSMNGKTLDGNFLRVDHANQSKPKDKNRTVFLGNLPFTIEDNEVWEAFKGCGRIESVRIIRDRKTGVGRGFGYINFESADGAVLAMDLNGTTIKNRELRVKVNTPEGKKKQRDEKKGKKRQFAEGGSTESPKKLKTGSETAQVAKHNSLNAERRTDKKKRSQGEKQRGTSQSSSSSEGKSPGKFQGQKADGKKKSKPNKHAKKKMQMAAKLLAKPKKPSAN